MPQVVGPEILIVDDDPDTCEQLASLMVSDGYRAVTALSGRQALTRLAHKIPDCLVLDYAMPEVSGLEVLRQIRDQDLDIPIVMLSAKADSYDRVAGYSSGADIYVGKHEDVAVLRSAVRRLLVARRRTATVLEVGQLRLDLTAWKCYFNGAEVALPPRLFTLLRLLASQPGRVYRKEQILSAVWGVGAEVYDRVVDNAVVDLRRMLGDSGRPPSLIHTVRGVGYKLEVK